MFVEQGPKQHGSAAWLRRAPAWLSGGLQSLSAALWEIGLGFRRLMGRSLRRTSLLLMIIWFANALTYYGLVLLTTTVSVLKHEFSFVD